MKARLINTKFWSDTFISELNPLDRYLFLYFLTNEHTNIAGVYELPLKTISFETGMEIDMLKKMLKRLTSRIMYIDGWVCIKNFQKNQSQSEDVKTGINREMSNIPESVRLKLEKGFDLETVGGVSLDGVGDLTKLNLTKPNLKAEHSSADIVLLLDLFSVMNPAVKRMYGNITQRKACRSLIDTYGMNRLTKIISETLPKTNGLQFFPTITTPLQLQDKFIQLESAIRKYQSEKLLAKDKYKVI